MDESQQRSIVEALILGAQEPLSAQRIAGLIPRCKPAAVKRFVEELNGAYKSEGRAFEIWEVAGGYRVRTLPEFAPYIQQLQPTRPLRLSPAALETLAIVAYRQPVTRAEVEQVRGVDAGAMLRSQLERKLMRIAGHREVPGRPLLYGTNRRFLEVFGLDRLGDLPRLRELEELLPAGGPEGEEAGEAVLTEEGGEGDEIPVAVLPPDGPPAGPEAAAFEEAGPTGKPH